MEIRIKTPKGVEVLSLNVGDVVEYLDDYYMMIDKKDYNLKLWYCVDLRTGTLEALEFHKVVFKLDTVLTLSRIGEEI